MKYCFSLVLELFWFGFNTYSLSQQFKEKNKTKLCRTSLLGVFEPVSFLQIQHTLSCNWEVLMEVSEMHARPLAASSLVPFIFQSSLVFTHSGGQNLAQFAACLCLQHDK